MWELVKYSAGQAWVKYGIHLTCCLRAPYRIVAASDGCVLLPRLRTWRRLNLFDSSKDCCPLYTSSIAVA